MALFGIENSAFTLNFILIYNVLFLENLSKYVKNDVNNKHISMK